MKWRSRGSIFQPSNGRHTRNSKFQIQNLKLESIMAYSNKVLDHYNNPRNVGSFDQKDRSVGTGLVGAPECGDVLKLQIKVDPVTGRIEDARFKTFGCGSAIASSS